MRSFQALLSTEHRGGYSQGLIHRKARIWPNLAHAHVIEILRLGEKHAGGRAIVGKPKGS